MKCMRCNGPFVRAEEIYCQRCYDALHIEWCHKDTGVCDCEEKFKEFVPYIKAQKEEGASDE